MYLSWTESSYVGKLKELGGIELHVPTEITKENEDDVAKVLDDYGLQMVQLCGHTWTEKHYIHGSLADMDPKIRQIAIDRVKEALDMGVRFMCRLVCSGLLPTVRISHCNPITSN